MNVWKYSTERILIKTPKHVLLGGGYFAMDTFTLLIRKKKHLKPKIVTIRVVFCSLEHEESFKNIFVALQTHLHVENVLQR